MIAYILEDSVEPDKPLWFGNRKRSLWKSACLRLSKEPKISKYERAIYGVLSGNLDQVYFYINVGSSRLRIV